MAKGGGFLNNFAYGASTELKEHADTVDKANAAADAAIREKVAAVDPEAELYQRKADIDAAKQAAENKAKTQMGMDQFQSVMGSSAPVDNSTPAANPINPTATISTPSVGMAPSGSAPASSDVSTMTPDEHYAALTKATTGKALADLSGNKGASAAFDTQIQLHKTELDRSKRTAEDNKDTLTAADGTDVPKDILTDAAKNSTAGKLSIYQTGSLQKPMSDPEVGANEEKIAADIHAPLAASYMHANKGNQEVASVIKEKTLGATQDIVTMNSPDAPIQEKQKAVTDFQSYMQDTYKNYSQKQIEADTNLHHVVTPKLMSTMDQIMKTPVSGQPSADTSGSAGAVTIPDDMKTPAPATPTTTTPNKVLGTWNPATGKLE